MKPSRGIFAAALALILTTVGTTAGAATWTLKSTSPEVYKSPGGDAPPNAEGTLILTTGGTTAGAARAQAVNEQSRQRVHGKVEKIESTTVGVGSDRFVLLTIKTDDGRTISADVSRVNEAIRKPLTRGEGVTVVGQWKGNQSHMVAGSMRRDSPAAITASPKTGK